MNKEEFIGKLEMVYVGDRNAFNEIVEDNQKLKNEVVYSKVEIDRLNETIEKKNTYYDNLAVDYRIEHEEKNRLNNKLLELEDINEKIGLALDSAENKVDRLNNIIKDLIKDIEIIVECEDIDILKMQLRTCLYNKLKELKENNK